MTNAHGRSIDKTHLSIDQAEARGFIHRDYIAHCLRWSHVIKHLQRGQRYRTADILDIGCGKEFPLAKTLYTSKMSPREYVGVDVNRLVRPAMFEGKDWFEFESETDICDIRPGYFTPFQVVTCFEVLEHVEPDHSRRILHAIKENLHPDGYAFVSTPCWDPHVGAAGNHVNEIKYEPLSILMEEIGFEIHQVFGTFASQRDIEPELFSQFGGEFSHVYHLLKEYYDSNYLATVFAPLVPWKARNCLWVLTHPSGNERKFWLDERNRDLSKYVPWTSSERWKELFDAGTIHEDVLQVQAAGSDDQGREDEGGEDLQFDSEEG